VCLNAAAAGPLTLQDDEAGGLVEFDPYLFIKHLPPLDAVVPRFRDTILPKKTRACKQRTLVLDLDETLVHSCLEACADADFAFAVLFNQHQHIVNVKQRPHLRVGRALHTAGPCGLWLKKEMQVLS
jgi:CTD small phosphatase-like protein 2